MNGPDFVIEPNKGEGKRLLRAVAGATNSYRLEVFG